MNSHWITTSAAPCLFMILFVYLSLISSLIFLRTRARTGSLILLATVSRQRVEPFGLSYKPPNIPPFQTTSTLVGEISRLGRSSVRDGPPPWQAATKSQKHLWKALWHNWMLNNFPPLIHRSYYSFLIKCPHYLLHFSVSVFAPQQ